METAQRNVAPADAEDGASAWVVSMTFHFGTVDFVMHGQHLSRAQRDDDHRRPGGNQLGAACEAVRLELTTTVVLRMTDVVNVRHEAHPQDF